MITMPSFCNAFYMALDKIDAKIFLKVNLTYWQLGSCEKQQQSKALSYAYELLMKIYRLKFTYVQLVTPGQC